MFVLPKSVRAHPTIFLTLATTALMFIWCVRSRVSNGDHARLSIFWCQSICNMVQHGPPPLLFFSDRSKLSMLGIALDSGMVGQVNVELPGNWNSIVRTAEDTNIFHFEGFRDCLMLMMFILWGESCGNQSHLCHGSVVATLHACAVRAVRPLTAPGAVACPQWPGAFWLGVVRPGESRVDLHWISQAVWKESTALFILFVKRAKDMHVFNRKINLCDS